MGDPTPLANHAVAAPADRRITDRLALAGKHCAGCQKKNGRREGARVASVE